GVSRMDRRRSLGSFTRSNILASAVGGIATAFFLWASTPIAGFLWGLAGHTTSRYVQSLTDDACRMAAHGPRELILVRFEMDVSSLLLGLVLGTVTFIVMRQIKRLRGDRKRSVQERARQVARWKKTIRIVFCGYFLLLLGVVYLWIERTARDFLELQFRTTFEQRLTVLSPELSDKEIKRFRASWASMKGRSDYDAIMTELDTTANTKNVALPGKLPFAD
ncbi:MAG TPA: hypothetical protein VG125_14615, partial [Pirellulales bacterium]|nr:hypothetical protein [Pirellulales bacterium]